MSEQELRDGLRSAVEDEPPMKVDLDEIVSLAERLVRRRRALVAVGVGTAAVTLAAVTVPVVLGIARGEPAELPVGAPPSAAAPVTPQNGDWSVQQLAERGRALQAYLTNRFPAVVPGAIQIDARPFGGEAEGQFFDGQKYLSGSVRYVMHGAKTAILLEIHASSDPDTGSKNCPGCDIRTQPDQSTVVLETDQTTDMIIAKHFRQDGSVVTVNTYGHDPAGSGAHGSAAKLTLDQLVSLATDPELHM